MADLHVVKDYMDKRFVTLQADMDVYKAIDILLEKGVTSAVVTDDHNQAVGILSEKDCLHLIAKDSYHQLPSAKVSNFMTCDVFCVSPSTSIFKIADIFLHKHFRRIIVTDAHNEVIGQITRRDLLRIIKQWKTEEREKKVAPIL
ncbi:MAG: CBS domain-containing protein [Calditrichaceae bacterium]|nr:CBS domain-containing protein [Calditrichaceae bacterium]MBN2707936.1 CBS domain-containing protein [Calditrichaceae bacterium]RQV95373.1 MAG: CBS domain-containing protein [Calditrichota bacterium]